MCTQFAWYFVAGPPWLVLSVVVVSSITTIVVVALRRSSNRSDNRKAVSDAMWQQRIKDSDPVAKWDRENRGS